MPVVAVAVGQAAPREGPVACVPTTERGEAGPPELGTDGAAAAAVLAGVQVASLAAEVASLAAEVAG